MRRGRVRPGADDREMGLVVALGEQPFAYLSGDVGLGATDQPAGGDLGHDPVGCPGGQRQQCDLVGVLDHPDLAQERRGEREPRIPEAVLERQQVAGRQVVRDGRAAGRRPVAPPVARTSDAASAWASSPSSQVTTGSRPAAAGGARRAGAASSRGTTSDGSPAAGITSIVSRSSGIAA